MSLSIKAASAVIDGRRSGPVEVTVENGVIVSVAHVGGEGGSDGSSDGRAPANSSILVPGLVDLQVNGVEDVHCATAVDDDWERLDELLIRRGVTTWCPTIISSSLDSYAEPLDRIQQAATRDGARPAIAGAHLEGPFLTVAGAHDPAVLCDPEPDWIDGLPPVVAIVTLAPERPGALAAIEQLTGRGVTVSLGHTAAEHDEMVAATRSGARMVTHLYNAMAGFHHRAPGPIGAALAVDELTVGLIADLEHVHPAALRTAIAAKGSGRWLLVSDSVAAGPGSAAPRTTAGRLAGATASLADGVANVVHHCGVPLADAVTAATATPAELLGLSDRGKIRVGARADLCLLDERLTPTDVWIGGTPVLVDGAVTG